MAPSNKPRITRLRYTTERQARIAQIFLCSGSAESVPCCDPSLNSKQSTINHPQRERASAFTLIELLVVIGIIGLLMVLIVPAFTSLRSGTDVTSAAYTIKGVLDTARTYAKANNTYTWVGFFEEDVSNPPNAGIGRIVMSIVASRDG